MFFDLSQSSSVKKKRLAVNQTVGLYACALCVCSVMSNSFATPWTVASQAHLSMKFSRQEHWSGLPFLPPGDLPHPRIKPTSLTSPALAVDSFSGKPPFLRILIP